MNGAGKNSKEYERPADRRRRLGCEQDLRARDVWLAAILM